MIGMKMRDHDTRDWLAAQLGGKDLLPQCARFIVPKPQSTMVQPSPSANNHKLMCSSANGSGMRNQNTPDATSRSSPAAVRAEMGIPTRPQRVS